MKEDIFTVNQSQKDPFKALKWLVNLKLVKSNAFNVVGNHHAILNFSKSLDLPMHND